MKEKILILCVVLCTALYGICATVSKLSETKDYEQYSQGLKLYKSKDFKAAYHHFGNISLLSPIKTPAMFRRARCSEQLGDIRGAEKNYSKLLFMYPYSELYVVSEYNLAMIKYQSNDKSAKKHFLHIIKYYPDTDYALASEYYLASMDLSSANKSHFYGRRMRLKRKAISHFIKYIKLSPDGRFAQPSIDNINHSGIVISYDDNLVIADSYYKRNLYAKAAEYYKHTLIKNSWAKYAKNEFKRGSNQFAKSLTETGLKSYSENVDRQDMYDAVDGYINLSDNKLFTINYLLKKYPQAECTDYLLFLKAQYSNENNKYSVYSELYNKYPNSNFSAEALYKVFLSNIFKKDYENALRLGQKHYSQFKTSDTTPAVLFWMGKIYEKQRNYPLAKSYYKNVIAKYPDSYYSYRAYSKLNNKDWFIDKTVKSKPIIFPCEDKKEREMISKLIELGDYDFVEELYKDNKFVQSWIAYKQGKPVYSVILAQEAMKDTFPKPDFTDVRWRLVYPLNYYSYVDKYKGELDPLLIMSVIREESHFSPDIKSPVGAVGLMQLMPATAQEIANANSLSVHLTNPQNNIHLGCLYFSKMKKSLRNNDAYAVMAYNGGWHSVNRWINTLSYDDTDEFIEKIPYPETQMYVKKVLRSFWSYSNIYN